MPSLKNETGPLVSISLDPDELKQLRRRGYVQSLGVSVEHMREVTTPTARIFELDGGSILAIDLPFGTDAPTPAPNETRPIAEIPIGSIEAEIPIASERFFGLVGHGIGGITLNGHGRLNEGPS